MSACQKSLPMLFPETADTIAAISTASGRAAIAVLRVSGPLAHSVGSRAVQPWKSDERRPYQATLWDCQTGSVIDKPVVTVYHAPRSYTGEDLVELSVHGGTMVPALGLVALLHAGAREAHGGEFTRRAVLNGKIDLLQAEGVGDLIDARSAVMHASALAQLEGKLSSRISLIQRQLLDMEALVVYDIDFPEEDDGPITPERIGGALDVLQKELDGLLRSADIGELYRDGVLVVIAGAPNAGKSSLFNALIGRNRSIVTDLPGTTRDALEAVIELGGWTVRLVDTAGLRVAQDVIEQMGIEVSEEYLSRANYVLACGESLPTLAAAIEHIGATTSAPIIPIWTKADLRKDAGERKTVHLDGTSTSVVSISVHSEEGIELLLTSLVGLFPPLRSELTLAESAVLTRERHRQSVQRARDEIGTFAQLWREGKLPISLATTYLKSAETALEEMIGTVEIDDVLDNLFRTFCVGK
ncbi:MAG: tRNA uridine-5-carboxymethylaminomethyl(34) synthesis GTPase MnmE [Gemmatimonadaceae bacterium]